MNKKYLMFGIPLSILAIVLVSAALVGYLSDEVTADIELTSPMVVGISDGLNGEENWGGKEFPDADWNYDWEGIPFTILDSEGNPVNGGETVTLYTLSENIANVEITGFEEAIVTNPGITCDDFESVKVYVDSIYGDLGYGSENNALDICVQDGYNRVKFDSQQYGEAGLSTWGAGEADVSKMVVTFKSNALGTYTFSYKVIPAE